MLLQAVDYLPFGKTLTYEVTTTRIKGKKGGYKNKYHFANKQLDEETDLQYFEKRYYDPRIGRFTTEDPVTWEVGLTKRPNQYFTDPQQWNSYSYVRNNPINLVDPTGEIAMVLGAGVVSTTVVVTVSTATLITLGAVVVVAGVLYTVVGLSGNDLTLRPSNTGAGQTLPGAGSLTPQSSAIPIDDLIVAMAATTTAGSPPPSGGNDNNGNSGPKKDSKNNGAGESKSSSQDKVASKSQLEQLAKKNGYKDAHALKDAYLGKTGNNSKFDAYFTRLGELYFKSKPIGGRTFEPIFTNIII